MRYLILISILLTGCAQTVGNLVTDVSSDEQGNLIVEKCIIERNGFANTYDYKSCTTKTLHSAKGFKDESQ